MQESGCVRSDSPVQATVPNSQPSDAVTAMASAPQRLTRMASIVIPRSPRARS